MEKQKLNKIILIVLIPVFLLGLSYRLMKGWIGAAKTTTSTGSGLPEQIQDVKIDIINGLYIAGDPLNDSFVHWKIFLEVLHLE